MRNFKIMFLFVAIIFTSQLFGRIYACIDATGNRHYSDKKCPVNKLFKTEIIEKINRVKLPDSVLKYTDIINVLKRTLSTISAKYPNSTSVLEALKNIRQIEISHNNILARRLKISTRNYNPIGEKKLKIILSAISRNCRIKAHMTVCGAIEGYDWLKDTGTGLFLQS